jgi:hypothetical protein
VVNPARLVALTTPLVQPGWVVLFLPVATLAVPVEEMVRLAVEPAIMVPVAQGLLVKAVIAPVALQVRATHAVVKAKRAAPAVVLEGAVETNARLVSAAC